MNMRIAGLVVLAVLCASGASAQSSIDQAPVASTRDGALKLPVFVWAGAVAADQITTYRFSIRYGDLMHEENPLIRGLDGHPALLIAVGSGIDATTGWLAYRLLARHPRLAQVAFYGAAAYRGYLAAHNIQMMRLAEDIRAQSALPTPPR
jgi:hypothetical protein